VSARRLPVEEPPRGGRAVLDPATSKHARRVLRLGPGAAVVLFDGRGSEWDGVVRGTGKGGVVVEVRERREAPPPAPPRLVLAVSPPKGKRMATLLAMATEAGVDAVVPLACARTPEKAPGPARRARWERTILQAVRQSGRAWSPTMGEPRAFDDLVAAPAAAGVVRLLALPPRGPGEEGGLPPAEAGGVGIREIVVLVGPEGGFTPEEEAAARAAGLRPLSLGPFVLRVETAAVAAVVLLRRLAPDTSGLPPATR
jgi:16S rRNA (uracil1498-N3)-methyltransferase